METNLQKTVFGYSLVPIGVSTGTSILFRQLHRCLIGHRIIEIIRALAVQLSCGSSVSLRIFFLTTVMSVISRGHKRHFLRNLYPLFLHTKKVLFAFYRGIPLNVGLFKKKINKVALNPASS